MTLTETYIRSNHLIGISNINKTKIMATLITALIVVIVFLLFIGFVFVYDTLAWGLILYKFWGWFVLPVFVTAPALTFIQALGLMFVVGLFKSHFTGENLKDEYKKNTWGSSVTILLYPWVALFFGWLAYVIWIV